MGVTIVCKRFSRDVTEDQIREHFGPCDEITGCRIVYCKETQESKGIAFLDFASTDAVDEAVKSNGQNALGGWLVIDYNENSKTSGGKGKDGKSKGKGKDGGKSKEFEIFVGGLPWETEEAVLKKDFAECGEIVALRMPLNDEGKARGIAFVEYTNQESVDKALKFHETEYGGRTISVRKAGEPAPAKGEKGKGKGNSQRPRD